MKMLKTGLVATAMIAALGSVPTVIADDKVSFQVALNGVKTGHGRQVGSV